MVTSFRVPTLHELDQALPNGFHDAYIRSYTVDFVARTVLFELNIWVGDLASEQLEIREHYRAARLLVSGVHYCFFDPPFATYPFSQPKALWVDLCDPDPDLAISKDVPTGVFASRFYVENWNSFIHVAAAEASLVWIEADSNG